MTDYSFLGQSWGYDVGFSGKIEPINERFQAAERNLHAVLRLQVGAGATVATLAFGDLRKVMAAWRFRDRRAHRVRGNCDRRIAGVLFSVPRVVAKDNLQALLLLGNKLAATPAANLSRYWFPRPAAYGQKNHHLPSDASAEERGATRDAVLHAGRKAVELSQTARRALKNLTDPTGIDNDLQDFTDDPDLKRIVDKDGYAKLRRLRETAGVSSTAGTVCSTRLAGRIAMTSVPSRSFDLRMNWPSCLARIA